VALASNLCSCVPTLYVSLWSRVVTVLRMRMKIKRRRKLDVNMRIMKRMMKSLWTK